MTRYYEPSSLKDIVSLLLKTKVVRGSKSATGPLLKCILYTPNEIVEKCKNLPLGLLEYINKIQICFACSQATSHVGFKGVLYKSSGEKSQIIYVLCSNCIRFPREFIEMMEDFKDIYNEAKTKGWLT